MMKYFAIVVMVAIFSFENYSVHMSNFNTPNVTTPMEINQVQIQAWEIRTRILNVSNTESNETWTSADENIIPRCSKHELFHSSTNKCYAKEGNGPCNIYSRWSPCLLKKGRCTCKFFGDENIREPVRESLEDGKCYAVYSKANCNYPYEWFDYVNGSWFYGHCTQNPCRTAKADNSIRLNETSILQILGRKDSSGPYPLNPTWMVQKGRCVQPFTSASCGPPGGNYTIYFNGALGCPFCAEIDLPKSAIESFLGSRDCPQEREILGSIPRTVRNRHCTGGFVGCVPTGNKRPNSPGRLRRNKLRSKDKNAQTNALAFQ